MQPGLRLLTEKYSAEVFEDFEVLLCTFCNLRLGLMEVCGPSPSMTRIIWFTGMISFSLFSVWEYLLFCVLLCPEDISLSSWKICSSRRDSFGLINIS